MTEDQAPAVEEAEVATPTPRKKKAATKPAAKKKATKKEAPAEKEATGRGAPAKHPQGKKATVAAMKKAVKAAGALERRSLTGVVRVGLEAEFDNESLVELATSLEFETTEAGVATLRRKFYRDQAA
jgi:hypothetical protein